MQSTNLHSANDIAGPSQLTSARRKLPHVQATEDRPDVSRRRVSKFSLATKTKKREDIASRLKRHIKQAQEQLEVVQREEEEAKAVKEVDKALKTEDIDTCNEDKQGKFNELVLQ